MYPLLVLVAGTVMLTGCTVTYTCDEWSRPRCTYYQRVQVQQVPPQVVVQAPTVTVTEDSVKITEYYKVEEGLFIGIYAGRYYFLGGNGLWYPCKDHHMVVWNEWRARHPVDWRIHIIRDSNHPGRMLRYP